MLNEMGINVIETEKAEADEEEEREKPSKDWLRPEPAATTPKAPANLKPRIPSSAPTTRCACICARCD